MNNNQSKKRPTFKFLLIGCSTIAVLVVAMIIQVFNNYFTSRIDKLIIDMEESSVELIEALSDIEGKK